MVGGARAAGYTPQTMVPLYVRNTLFEKNGTTPGGDQTQETMAKDRRYSHYIGRPLNRFEPDAARAVGATGTGNSNSNSSSEAAVFHGREGSVSVESSASKAHGAWSGESSTVRHAKPPLGAGRRKGLERDAALPALPPAARAATAGTAAMAGAAALQHRKPRQQQHWSKKDTSNGSEVLSQSLGSTETRRPTRKERRQAAAAAQQAQLDAQRREQRRQRKLIRSEMQKVTHLPITKSLVRLAFSNPLPSLEDLQHLDEDI